MIPRQGTWGELHVGAFMKDKTGVTWKVTAERDFHLQVKDREGTTKHLKPRNPSTPVTILTPTPEEATRTIEDVLGGGVLAELYRGHRVWAAGEFRTKGPAALLDAKAHLHMMHGTWANDIKTMAEALEAHEHFHEHPETSCGLVPHHHG